MTQFQMRNCSRASRRCAERESVTLDTESQRLLDVQYQRFVLAGARLSNADKTTLTRPQRGRGDPGRGIRREAARREQGRYAGGATPSELDRLSRAQVASAAAAAASTARWR
jgi:peptidyl-dipeptidase Dcp